MYKSKHKVIALLLISGLLFIKLASAELPSPNNQQWKLTEEQWDLVKQGEQLLEMPVLQQLVDAWSLQQGQAVELRYPGGEEGELWVEELKDWLISLAIPSKYLFAVAGSGEADVIIIKIIKVGDV
ncbi:MAG: hypothetical protein KAJ92_03470 [Gammaproteobacteria bacterium]|nr:hypothetical protein [Gammaproteobacteria bacterium]MCK5262714.1 hypothetical protein [Gammaproteobacteria bacterium]